jgi:serine/threonine-protein kinase
LEAADLLNQAVARDPSFVQAYWQLASIHDRLYLYGIDHTPARLALAEAAGEAASRLRPDAGETHLYQAQHFYTQHNYDNALAELEIAAQKLPNHASVAALKGYIQRRQGRWEESTRNLERAVELDPRDINRLRQLVLSYEEIRDYAKQFSLLERALAIEPDNIDMKLARAEVELAWKADTRPLHQLIAEIRATNPAAVPSIAGAWLSCALVERDAAVAKDALIALGENTFGDNAVQFPRRFMEGVIARMTKDEHKAQLAFTAARAEQEKRVQAQPDYGPALCVLGLIDAALGRKEEALREGRRAVELLPVEKDSANGQRLLNYVAMIAAWVGEKDLACEQFAIAARYPLNLSYGALKLDPFWDPLRGEPCFEKIVASLAPKPEK